MRQETVRGQCGAEQTRAPASINFLCLLALTSVAAIVVSVILIGCGTGKPAHYQNEVRRAQMESPALESCGEYGNRHHRKLCEERNHQRIRQSQRP